MNYPPNEAEARYGPIRRGMQQQGIDLLLVYSPQWKLENVHYVSNYRLLGWFSCVLLPLEKDPILYISEPADLARAAQSSWVRDIRVCDGKEMAEVASVARGLGSRLGIAGLGLMTAGQYGAFAACFEGIQDALALVDRAAMIKTPWEIDQLRRGGQLADIGFRVEFETIRPGLAEYELAADMNEAMMAAGADDNFQMLAAGQGLSCMHVPRENKIAYGDLVLTEITPMVGCITNAVQLCRTVKLGRATSVEKEKYGMLVEALEAALAIIRPGVQAKEVALAQNKIIGGRGYEKYCNPPYMRSRGHNFGLGQFELTVDNEMELQPGMCMVVHPNQFVPETGYLACGESVIVTQTGIERLSSLEARLYEKEEVAL